MSQLSVSTGPSTVSTGQRTAPKSPWNIFLHKFVRQPVSMVVSAILLLILVLAVIGSFRMNQAQLPDYNHLLSPPSMHHWFGTDDFGRDIFTRVIAGAHLSLIVGLSSVVVGSFVGTSFGLLAGYYGGWTDSLIMRGTDVLLAFPGMLLAIGVIAILGGGMLNVILAVAVFTIPIFTRLVHGSTIAIKNQPYIEGARVAGASDYRIIVRYIVPNMYSIVLVYLTMRIGTAILIAAGLSFLGLGVSPSSPEWGAMLNSAHDYISSAPWTIMAPGLAILMTVLSFNLLGDGLRDAIDSKIY